MELTELGIVPIFRTVNKRKGGYEHKDQIEFYLYKDGHSEASPQFRKCYRYIEKSIESLVALFGKELLPKAGTNNAFTATQRLCIALRFYATGTHQSEVGDGEGASQASVSRIIRHVTKALTQHADDLIKFSLDQEVLEEVSKGFYGFKASE